MGVDDAIVESIAAGAVGWIAGLVNAFPRESVELFTKPATQLLQFDLPGLPYHRYLTLVGQLDQEDPDVTGHGVGPALLMAETRAYLRTLVMSDADVGKILTRANRMLADDVGFERYRDPLRSPNPGDKNYFVVLSRIQLAF